MNELNANDDDDRAGEADDFRLLDSFERRLKAYRPRAPRFELATNCLPLETRSSNHVALPELPTGPSRIALVSWGAGSWTCGAIVGAMLTFVLMRQPTHDLRRIGDGTTTTAAHVPTAIASGERDARGEPPWLDSASTDSQSEPLHENDESMSDGLANIVAAIGNDRRLMAGGLLRAGVKLVSQSVASEIDSVRTSHSPAIAKETTPAETNLWRSTVYDSVPIPTPVTRGILLQDLLETIPERVY